MKTTQIILATALSVGGLAFVGCDDQNGTTGKTTTETKTTETRTSSATPSTDANPTAGERVSGAMDKTGDALKNAADRTGTAINNAADKTGTALTNAGANIRDTVSSHTDNALKSSDTDSVNGVREQISEIAEAALTKNGIDNIKSRLADNDQSRLKDLDNKNDDELNGLVKSIEDKWQAKYGHKFDMNAKVALNDTFLMLGAPMGEARTAGERTDTTAINTPATPNTATSGAPSSADNAANAHRGDMLTVNIPASHNMPALTLNMVKQDMSWKLDLPDTQDAAAIKAGLTEHLRMVDQMSANWPADENEAYRAVTHHVLAGLEGVHGSTTPAAQ